MARSVRALAAIALLAAGCSSGDATPSSSPATSGSPTSQPAPSETTTTAPFDAAPVDWNDRSTVDVALPSGWHLTACEGDAPILCAENAAGEIDGTIMLLEYPASGDSPSLEDVEADARELYRVTEEDRQRTCGTDFTLVPDEVEALTVAGAPGYRYGYELRDPAGQATERIVLHVTSVDSRLVVISTAFSDPEGCPGEDPERIEFPIGAFAEIEPYLDELAAESTLTTGT